MDDLSPELQRSLVHFGCDRVVHSDRHIVTAFEEYSAVPADERSKDFSERPLTRHLYGTYRLLCDWGCEPDVCTAGLFHSIYGTQFFTYKTVSPARRSEVAARIGSRTENLCFLFAACDRVNHFQCAAREQAQYSLHFLDSEQTVTVNRRTYAALLQIELANVLEQLPPVETLHRNIRRLLRGHYAKVRRFVPAAAFLSLRSRLPRS